MNNYRHGIPIPKYFLLIMRVTFLLFIVGVLQSYAANTYAQETQLTLKENNIELGELLNKIENQTDFYFFYSNDKIDKHRKVNVDVTDQTIAEILNIVLKNTDITYQVNNKAIILNKSVPVASQQTKKISGVVTDALGETVIGANVSVKGTTNGTITDIDGKFSLEVPANAILAISYIGYMPQEIAVRNQSNLKIVLREDSQMLDEVVVVGYGTVKKSDLTGAISQIDPTKREASFTTNATDLLRNAVAGMNIPFSTSAKGNIDTKNILIRGTNSIKASNGPLVVLDGIVWDGDLADISSSDIERIDVMKDASSAAIYGSRAANGVIQITTKKGSIGAPVVTLSTNFGFTKAYELRKALDGPGYVNMRENLMQAVRGNSNSVNGVNYYNNPSSLSGDALNQWMGFSNATGDPATEWLTRLNFYPIEIENYMAGRTMDWADLIFQTGFKQDYNMNISEIGRAHV